MKNFRKVLALILVVATLFSFVAMASAKSASEYTDYDEVKYVEAVDVLTALGIINGYDGAYHPADTIDRDEMAKMIAVLRNGGDFDADLFASANKFADVKGQWAEGYIAYCAQLGIIAGRNATTFDPDAPVKVVEVAKQLLCVLGFDAAKQGYVGANWEVAVIRDAAKYGLIPAGVDAYAAATRDEAAQMFLNALQCNLVAGYVSENVVYITNSLYVGKDKAGEYHWTNISLKEAEKKGWEFAYGNAVVSTTPLSSIYGNLKYTADATYDCFGRPGHKWSLVAANGKETVIGFYADAPKWTTDAPTEANVAAALKAADDDYATTKTVYAVRNGAQAYAAYGNGIETELYKLASGNLLLVQIDTFIAKVGDINTYKGTFTLINEDKQAIHTFKLGDYELAVGDMVLYQFCNGAKPPHASANACKISGCTDKLHNVTVVEPIEVTMKDADLYSTYDTSSNDVTLKMKDNFSVAEGTTYYYSDNYGVEMANYDRVDADEILDAYKKGAKTWKVYVDQNGYVMYVKPNTYTATTEYAYVVEKTATASDETWVVGNRKWTYTADLVKFGADGALTVTEDMAINEALYNEATRAYEQDFYVNVKEKEGKIGTLIRYSYDKDGKFDFVKNPKPSVYNTGFFAAVGTKISNTKNVLGGNVIATDETVFMVRTKDSNGKYVYTQYTDYRTLPGEYTAMNMTTNGHERTNIQFFYDNSAVEGNEGGLMFATYVFIDAMYQKADAKHFFTLGTLPYQRWEAALIETGLFTDEYFVYDGYVDGVRGVIASDHKLVQGKFYDAKTTYLFDVTVGGQTLPLFANVSPKDPTVVATFALNIKDGQFYIGDKDKYNEYLDNGNVPVLADDAKVYIFGSTPNADGKNVLTIKSGRAELADFIDYKPDAQGYMVLNSAKTEVTELYLFDVNFANVDIWN